MGDIRAVTLRQPWAGLLASGLKPVENRTWRTGYRGPLWLHAGAGRDVIPRVLALFIERGEDMIGSEAFHASGALIAEAELTGIHRDNGCCAPWGMPDQWHWEITPVRVLDRPVPARGALGFWRPPANVLQAVREQIGDFDKEGEPIND